MVAISLASPAFTSAESSFAAKINAERAARGLGQLEVYWDLKDDARAQTQRMMDRDELYHNPNLGAATNGWFGLGENVGVGPSVGVLHDAFMASSGHRANILGDYNYMGVGVIEESDTKMWVAVVFMKGPEGLVTPPEPVPVPEPEPAPAAEPEPTPVPAPEPVPAPTPEPVPVPKKAPAQQPTPVAANESALAPVETTVRMGKPPIALFAD